MLAYWEERKIVPKGMNLSEFQASKEASIRAETGIDFRHITINRGIPLLGELIPLPAFEVVDIFFCWESCGKVYWEGSPYEKVIQKWSYVILDGDEDDGKEEIEAEEIEEEWC